MPVLLILVIALPPLLLLLGVGLGVTAARWWWTHRGAALERCKAGDEEQAVAAALAAAVASAQVEVDVEADADLPPGRKDSCAKLPGRGGVVHLVASSASLQPPSRSAPSSEACLPLGLRLVSASPPHVARSQRPAALTTPDSMQLDGLGGSNAAAAMCALGGAATGPEPLRIGRGLATAGGSSSSRGGAAHRKTVSMDLGQLVRAGPSSVINQVMEDWEACSTLYRLMSMDAFNLPSPQTATAAAAAAAGLLSPAAALFSPAVGGGSGSGGGGAPLTGPMPSGEVHMDEIDLLECIGKGGYGCVYKASWRGAGVAVKYIVCPTEDSDSLGRAIREVVLSKKMSHPNVVQCYSWTVLSEPCDSAGRRTPTALSGISSPRDQSFTSVGRHQQRQLYQQRTGTRSSFDLLRPGSARRGLDLRFNAAAGGGGTPRAASSPALHRITERPTQEGRTLQQEIEAALGPHPQRALLSSSHHANNGALSTGCSPEAGGALEPVEERLIAEAVVEEAAAQLERQRQRQQQHDRRCCESAGPSRDASPEVEAVPVGCGKSPALKLQLPQPSSRSPSSSPGIQAVHGSADREAAGGFAGDEAAAAAVFEASQCGSPETCAGRDALSVEPADSLPSSPFAARLVQEQQPASDSGCDSSAEQLPGRAPLEHQQSVEDEDVYARFASYEEMVAYFQQLAGEGKAAACDEALLQRAALAAAEMSRSGSLRALDGGEFTVTAASSFSDVLSVGGFMLEGTASAAELSVFSQTSSPRHAQLRPGHASWFHPSAANSRPATPRAGSAPQPPSLLGMAASGSLLPSHFARAAAAEAVGCKQQSAGGSSRQSLDLGPGRLPEPAWDGATPETAQTPVPPAACVGAPAAVAPDLADGQDGDSSRQDVNLGAAVAGAGATAGQAAGNGCVSEDRPAVQPTDEPTPQHSSQEEAAVEPGAQLRAALQAGSAALRCSSTVSLSRWQLVPAGAICTLAVGQGSTSRLDMQQEGTHRAMPAAPAGSTPGQPCASAPQLALAAVCSSGSPTPRIGSMSNLGVAAGAYGGDASAQVTPRQQSLRCAAPGLQVSPRADSLRSVGRSAGSGRLRVEELREEAAAALAGSASCDRLSLGSHNESFNSEEGFGSPVKQRCGGVKDVFQLEELQLSGQEALMVVVMEYCDLGSLRKALKRKAFRPSAKWPFQTTYRALLRTAQEVAKGMGYIHEFNIVHGDLKPGNVLLKTHKVDRRGYIAKVSDFGLSRPLDCEETHASMGSALGTIAYTAPETFAHNRVKKPSDVYAFGIMLWEMFYCRDPYEGLLDGQICVGVTDGSLRPEFEEDCPEPYRRLAERCWHQDPELRPSFEEVDRELVRIEMEFRLSRHRANSKRASSAQSQGGFSIPPTRPGSPGVQPRSGGMQWQFQASALA